MALHPPSSHHFSIVAVDGFFTLTASGMLCRHRSIVMPSFSVIALPSPREYTVILAIFPPCPDFSGLVVNRILGLQYRAKGHFADHGLQPALYRRLPYIVQNTGESSFYFSY